MTETNDPLGGEVSLEVRLDETGVKAAAKSRLIAALDRLCGNLIDLPGGFFEGKAKRQRIKNQLQEGLMIAEGQSALDLAASDPEFGRRLLNNFTTELARKQLNKDSVAVIAVEYLREDPKQDVADQGEIEDDWLNLFSLNVENASSERLQKLWGKVLAGEIRKPGSFSLSTLRFISELDKEIASIFQSVVQERFSDQFILKPVKLEGQNLLDLAFLEEIGLLQQVTGIGGLNLNRKYDTDGNFLYKNRSLIIIAKGPPETNVEIPVIKITRTGREIASILPFCGDDVVLRKIAKILEGSASTIELGLIIAEFGDNQISWQLIEKIK